MDWHYVADALMAGFVSVVGFVMNRLFDRVDEIERNLRSSELTAAREFVTREDLQRIEATIYAKLDGISTELKLLAIKLATSERTGI